METKIVKNDFSFKPTVVVILAIATLLAIICGGILVKFLTDDTRSTQFDIRPKDAISLGG